MALIDVDWKPDGAKLRGFAWAGLVMFPLIGLLIRWQRAFLFWDMPQAAATVCIVLVALGVACGACALVWPRGVLPVYLLLLAVGAPIGFVLSFVLMGVIFFGMLTPLGLFFRLIGRDPLKKRLDPSTTSYWEKHRATDVSRYFKQF